MSDDTARALGAGDGCVTIDGRECKIRPLSVKELAEVERECLKTYKRDYLQTFSDNRDLLPEAEYERMLRDEFSRVARWDKSDLPTKQASVPDRVKVSKNLRKWLKSYYGELADPPEPEPRNGREPTKEEKQVAADGHARSLAAAALDSGELSPEDYRTFTGEPPPMTAVDYMGWWISGSFDGMITFVWSAFRDQGVTKDQIARELGTNRAMLSEVARQIEQLSVPDVGNGRGPAEET